ncbi:MAG: hypothetical protein NPIRA04_02640 [Nitrospirales bacterium]|nr:MAG: hypothetical protein NPIRA04_02640 [Nitrospirales bacterium]
MIGWLLALLRTPSAGRQGERKRQGAAKHQEGEYLLSKHFTFQANSLTSFLALVMSMAVYNVDIYENIIPMIS